MNEPKTPNLGLNKIDRSSPSTTYFDLDKYLDQNWEKVDEGVGHVEEKAEKTAAQLSSIQERLDTEKRRSVTLGPGLQVVNAERASAFKLEGLKGRTLVNLLGRDGGCENTSSWFTTVGVLAELDSSHKTQGSQSIKISLKGGSTGGSLYKQLGQTLSNSKNYLAIADLKRGTSTSVALSLWNGTANVSGTVVTADKFSTAILLIPASSLGTVTNNLQISIVGSEIAQFSHVDAVRLYEITSSELTSLSNMTTERIAVKYPYVDSIQPVRNPYVIRYGENLLPPFHEWTPTGSAKATSWYKVTITSTTNDVAALSYDAHVIPNNYYTLSIDQNDATISVTGGTDGAIIVANTSATSVTFNSGNRKIVRVYVSNYAAGQGTPGIGDFVFKNPMLSLGKTTKRFEPREDAVLALQTDLYANPITGTNVEELYEKDGQYFKLTKWNKVSLDGTLPWIPDSSGSGYKTVTLSYDNFVAGNTGLFPYTVKYDGSLLKTWAPVIDNADYAWLREGGSNLYITVSNSDSGWGDSYTPTVDDIKAYFMGWRMRNWNDLMPYNGSGEKAWGTVVSGGAAHWTAILPTTEAVDYKNPYQLIYQLATPTIEQIMSEGQLTFIEGDNLVEVGTGMIIRENVKPVYTSDVHKSYNINNYNLSAKLNSKVKKILSVYKNDVRDYWDILRFNPESEVYGLELASLPASQYDPSAYYSVTYQVQDQFSPISINGTIGVSEKSIIEQFINDSSNISRQLSVMESKNKEMEFQQYADKNFLKKSSSINENEDLNNLVFEGEFYCQLSLTAETLKNCPVRVAFSLKVSKNGTQNKESTPGVTQTLITFLPVGFTTWQRNLYDTWGAWVKVPSREEFESLKSSVSDGKSAIAAAITGKGVAASGSDTFSQLTNKIKQIEISNANMTQVNLKKSYTSGRNAEDFIIGTIPQKSVYFQFSSNWTNTTYFTLSVSGSAYTDGVFFALKDRLGITAQIGPKVDYFNYSAMYLISTITWDLRTLQGYYSGKNTTNIGQGEDIRASFTIPANFDREGPINFIIVPKLNGQQSVDCYLGAQGTFITAN
ncbi:pyocin knob domain-containing protein [Paenibacillus sp. USHLN196]|uniref:pyocin knob domain-containing protein n=1 Tax=Paenibacillus sp. USHLN196 TaxID=3081291 RepID=UPI0030184041